MLEKIKVRVRVNSRAREDLSCLPFLALLAARNRGASFAASFSGHENDWHEDRIGLARNTGASFATSSSGHENDWHEDRIFWGERLLGLAELGAEMLCFHIYRSD